MPKALQDANLSYQHSRKGHFYFHSLWAVIARREAPWQSIEISLDCHAFAKAKALNDGPQGLSNISLRLYISQTSHIQVPLVYT